MLFFLFTNLNVNNSGGRKERLIESNNLRIGDTFTVAVYGSDQTYNLKVAGSLRTLTKGVVMSEKYANEAGIAYKINQIFTNKTVSEVKNDTAYESEISTLKSRNDIIKSFDSFMEVMYLMIGALTAAGFEYGGDYFLENFPDINKKYGYTDMYSAGFHPFLTSEEKWGYWCRFIYLQRYKEGAKPLYKKLYELVKDKNYFVITTNVDHQFQLSGFSKERLFYTQGDYGLFQCSKPCHKKTYDNEKIVMEMVHSLKDGLIPSRLVPKCPICGEEMSMNLRSDNTFVEDEGWHEASHRYEKFLNENKDKKILFLELGVGWNTPVIIKYPFMRMTYGFKDAFYVCINKGFNRIPEEIKDKSIVLDDDINTLVK